jgi:hypothetical protein
MVEGICVPPHLAIDIWPSVHGFIEKALIRGGLGDLEDIKSKVIGGQMLLWLVMDGNDVVATLVTQLCIFNGDKCGTIVVCSGDGFEHYEHMQERLYDFFRAEGCRYVRVLGRPGWQRRLPEYHVRAVVLEKEL